MFWDSTSAQTATDKANLFSKFFHSVFVVDAANATFHSSSFPVSSLCSIEITLEDTFAALSSCDPSKATGGDRIPPIILKYTAAALAEPIHHLSSLCLSKSYLPTELRRHHITPIHKSGDRSIISNYHPISLLCCISKILKRLVFDNLMTLLPNPQSLTLNLDLSKTVPHYINSCFTVNFSTVLMTTGSKLILSI